MLYINMPEGVSFGKNSPPIPSVPSCAIDLGVRR